MISDFPSRAIGVFDSGVGGLTVVKEIKNILPNEPIIYLGDTARTPYGTRSPERIRELSKRNVEFLMSFNVKVVVVACNTSSAVALEYLRGIFDLPIIGVIEPSATLAVKMTKNMRIGVIGTEATVNSGAYQRTLLRINPELTVYTKACPLFVPLVEEGFIDGKIPELVAEIYLAELSEKGIDTLVLGCTHYPLLMDSIKRVIGDDVKIVDSASSVANEVRLFLEKNSLFNRCEDMRRIFFVTDSPERFKRIGERFLLERLDDVKLVEL